MVHPKMRTMSPMRQLDHLLHEVLRDASRGSSGCRMPITSSAPGSRGSSGCRMWSPGLRSPGCQALHLLHEVHEDPQDAGCELSAGAMSYLITRIKEDHHDHVPDLGPKDQIEGSDLQIQGLNLQIGGPDLRIGGPNLGIRGPNLLI